jgi:hypothetical protein
MNLAMSANQTKRQWVVYERRTGEFIFRSRPFSTRAEAERERDRLQARAEYKKVSLGVAVVGKR